jgi:PmbA protein
MSKAQNNSKASSFDLDTLKNITEDVISAAKKLGSNEVEASLSVGRGLSVNARLGEIETMEFHRDQGIAVTVYHGKKKGSASSTDFKQNSIQQMVEAACAIARHAEEDKFAGLPNRELLATHFPELSLYHPWGLSADEAVKLAIECEDAARSFHTDISNSEGASVQSFDGVSIFANSLGFNHGYPASRHSLSCSVIGERGGAMQRDYWYSSARSAAGLEAAEQVGKKAAERTIKRLGARSIGTRKCPVMYSPDVSGGLIGHFVSAIRGGALYRKSSFLLDSLHQRVFPEFMRIHEQPHLKEALGSAAYDGEGIATTARDIIQTGCVQGYVLSSYSARKLGLQTTANAGGVRNLTVESTGQNYQQMLDEMDTGFLVTELMGQGINSLTGDYSRGAAGFWVEGGEIQFPVEEVTIAGNLKEMYQAIVAVGNDADTRGNTRCGSILVSEMTLAGTKAS